MLAAMTHPSRVLKLDIKAEAYFKPKELYLTADSNVSAFGPHQCSADARMEVKLCSNSNDPTHVVSFKPCQSAQTRELVIYIC